MKTAISIPDPLFEEAEKLRRRLRVSRSELYATALRALVRRRGSEVTASLNRVYASEPSRIDPVIEALQLEVLARNKW
jgi:metal-responsive CopG/Arc/MetJ family transcriptional regulator